MKYMAIRLIVSTLVFLVFAWGSTVYYMKYIHDVGGTYWAMGVFGLPVVFIAIWCIDFYLKRLSFFQARHGFLTVIDSGLAVLLYYPGLVFVWGAIRVLGIA